MPVNDCAIPIELSNVLACKIHRLIPIDYLYMSMSGWILFGRKISIAEHAHARYLLICLFDYV